jgi:hypothetical protein
MYEGLVFANETLEWVYIFVPRCGSRSFRACGLFGKQEYPYEWKPKYEKYKKVALIRNPIDRVVSGFFYENGREWNPDHLIVAFRKYLQPLFLGKTTSAFVGNAQVTYLDKLKIDIEDLDVVLLTESYSENVESFKNKYNLDIETLHINASSEKSSQLLKEFIEENENVKNSILKYYKRDFELYERAKEKVIK